jgi:hypothetical protein
MGPTRTPLCKHAERPGATAVIVRGDILWAASHGQRRGSDHAVGSSWHPCRPQPTASGERLPDQCLGYGCAALEAESSPELAARESSPRCADLIQLPDLNNSSRSQLSLSARPGSASRQENARWSTDEGLDGCGCLANSGRSRFRSREGAVWRRSGGVCRHVLGRRDASWIPGGLRPDTAPQVGSVPLQVGPVRDSERPPHACLIMCGGRRPPVSPNCRTM